MLLLQLNLCRLRQRGDLTAPWSPGPQRIPSSTDRSSPSSASGRGEIMNRKIKELRAAARRKDLALLVVDGGGSTRVLPGGSALNLRSHLTVLTVLQWRRGPAGAAPLSVFNQGYRSSVSLQPPTVQTSTLQQDAATFSSSCLQTQGCRISGDRALVTAVAEFALWCSDSRPAQECSVHLRWNQCVPGFWRVPLGGPLLHSGPDAVRRLQKVSTRVERPQPPINCHVEPAFYSSGGLL